MFVYVYTQGANQKGTLYYLDNDAQYKLQPRQIWNMDFSGKVIQLTTTQQTCTWSQTQALYGLQM